VAVAGVRSQAPGKETVYGLKEILKNFRFLQKYPISTLFYYCIGHSEKDAIECTLTISQHGTGSYTGAWDRSAVKILPLLNRCTARPGNTRRELRRRKWPRVSCGNKN